MEFEYDRAKSRANVGKHGIDFNDVRRLWNSRAMRRKRFMSETNSENLEERFEAGAEVLDYFDTDVVLTIDRLSDLSGILNLSALSRDADINVQTLQAKIRRRTPLSAEETRRIVDALKRHHLRTVP
jgi:uncharacterized DUF497 family protein